MRQAEAAVQVGRSELDAAEQALFLAIASAYANVYYDRQTVKLHHHAACIANRRFGVITKRFREEDATQTDEDQTRPNQTE